MEDDGFTMVKRKNNKKNNNISKKGKQFLRRHHHNCLDDLLALKNTINIGSIRIDSLNFLLEQIEKCCIDLQHYHYIEEVKCSMAKCFSSSTSFHFTSSSSSNSLQFHEIVCFGLGNFTSSIASLYQLALLVTMRTELNYCQKVIVYDPCFTQFEIESLQCPEIGFVVLDKNTDCRYEINDQDKNHDQNNTLSSSLSTLIFMPHMYAIHYNNLVESNWQKLNRVILFGNSFQHLLSTAITNESNSDEHLNIKHSEFEYLDKLSKKQCYQILEYLVPNRFTFNDIFNNLSIHRFIVN